MALTLGVLNDRFPHERRVSITPDIVPRLKENGIEVLVESGAGDSAYFTDDMYLSSGAKIIASRHDLLRSAQILTTVQRPVEEDVSHLKAGTVIIGSILPGFNAELVEELEKSGAITFSLERIPRTTRAQSMDILSSQSTIAGYRAALLGAANSPKLMPMLTTAAGTVKPSRVLVVGAGVAGLMAIATLRRLGASVTAYDVRRSSAEDVRSLGARFLDAGIDATGEGGYARDLTEEEKKAQESALEEALVSSDLVLTTASVPGKKAPVIVSSGTMGKMPRGTVVVDLSADSGGNCESTVPGETVDLDGVILMGPLNLAAEAPSDASMMFARNMASFVELLVKDGSLIQDMEDPILAACLITGKGRNA